MNAPEPSVEEAATSLEDPRIVQAIQAYQEALENGEAPDREALLGKFPDLRDELSGCLDGLEVICRVAPQLQGEEDERSPSASLADPLSTRAAIGDFRIERELGRGGMGVVYEAEQMSLGRRVALKVLPFAAIMDERQLQRFKNEAQAAAHLHHANIVPVYSVGCERGVHHFAMQYVEGLTIQQTIQELRALENGGGNGEPSSAALTAITGGSSSRSTSYCRGVARLGIQAAEALDHAHQQGVVHRDIKPANLIVDASGHLWIMDFGLASFTSHPGLTMTGDIVGTVRYMSPEQALAKRVTVDHRTDIYSLSITLYELLTLKDAFPGDDPHQVIQEIASKDPKSARSLNPAVPGELETILIKAMAKDPAERYETAQELADDLERYLENKPIEARRPGLTKRAGKWARRHQAVVWAAAVVVLASTAAFGISAVRTRSALTRAENSLLFAHEAVDRFLKEIGVDEFSDEALPSASRRALLEMALEFYDTYLVDRSDPSAHVSRSHILHALRRYEECLAACDRALELDPKCASAHNNRGNALQGLERTDEALAAYDRSIELRPNSARTHSNRASALESLRRFEEALKAYEHALEFDPKYARAHNNRSVTLSSLGRFDEALAADDLAVEFNPNFAWAHYTRGNTLSSLGRFDEALAAYDRAVELNPKLASAHSNRGLVLVSLGRFRGALAAHDRALELDPNYASAHRNRGYALQSLSRFDEALAAYDRALALEPNHAKTHLNRGNTFQSLGRFAEALAAYDRALEIDPNSAMAHRNRGNTFQSLGRFAEALAAYDCALEIDPNHAAAHNSRGMVLFSLGRFAEALAAFDRALELDPSRACAHGNRGNALHLLGRSEEALGAYARALELDPNHAFAHGNRGRTLQSLGRFAEALAASDRALELNPKLAWAHRNRGDALRSLGRLAEALEAYDRALELDPKDAAAHYDRGMALRSLGRFEEALAAFDRALELDSKDAKAHRFRGCALQSLGRFDDALAAHDRALELDPKYAYAHTNRGNALAALRRFDEASEAYDRALELDPNYAPAHYGRGVTLSSLGRFEEALAAYDRALEFDPKDAGTHLNRGAMLHRLGPFDEALAAFDRALELDPKLAMAHRNRGRLLKSLERFDEALAAYDRALEFDPNHSGAHYERGNVLLSLRRAEEAFEAYDRALELDHRSPLVMNQVAWSLATASDPKLRNVNRAVDLARRAVKLAPTEGSYWNTLGVALCRAGRWEDAAQALENSMSLRKRGDSHDWFWLAMVLWQLDKKEQARQWYERAVAWMDRNAPQDKELVRLRREAAKLLGMD